jgi:prephenate dehydratase
MERSKAAAPPKERRKAHVEEAGGPGVAFQGEHGAFSEEALLGYFSGRARPLPRRDFQAVGEAVLGGEARYGILPVENTLAGSVQGSHDVLAEGGLAIVGEIVIAIRLFLMGIPGAREQDLRRILSHPVALAQCTRYLRGHPHAQAVAVHDTAGAAQEVARAADPTLGAIAPRGAAERYGLAVLAPDVQDRPDNQTRFYLVCREETALETVVPDESGAYRTVVLLELQDRPGALVAVLAPFASRGIDLSRIESRPSRTPWRYRFLLELRVHEGEPRAQEALDEASRASTELRVLGSFPVAPSLVV